MRSEEAAKVCVCARPHTAWVRAERVVVRRGEVRRGVRGRQRRGGQQRRDDGDCSEGARRGCGLLAGQRQGAQPASGAGGRAFGRESADDEVDRPSDERGDHRKEEAEQPHLHPLGGLGRTKGLPPRVVVFVADVKPACRDAGVDGAQLDRHGDLGEGRGRGINGVGVERGVTIFTHSTRRSAVLHAARCPLPATRRHHTTARRSSRPNLVHLL